jgi:hypothetical protein
MDVNAERAERCASVEIPLFSRSLSLCSLLLYIVYWILMNSYISFNGLPGNSEQVVKMWD